jgi:hypothetical protein
MQRLKVLNTGVERSSTPCGWTPDKRFINFEFPKQEAAPDTAQQARRSGKNASSLVRDAVATLNKRR